MFNYPGSKNRPCHAPMKNDSHHITKRSSKPPTVSPRKIRHTLVHRHVQSTYPLIRNKWLSPQRQTTFLLTGSSQAHTSSKPLSFPPPRPPLGEALSPPLPPPEAAGLASHKPGGAVPTPPSSSQLLIHNGPTCEGAKQGPKPSAKKRGSFRRLVVHRA